MDTFRCKENKNEWIQTENRHQDERIIHSPYNNKNMPKSMNIYHSLFHNIVFILNFYYNCIILVINNHS